MWPSSAHADLSCGSPVGDLDGNGVVNVVDASCCVQAALWDLKPKPKWSGPNLPPGSFKLPPACLRFQGVNAADQNCDSAIDVLDVQAIIAVVTSSLAGPDSGVPASTCLAECAPSCCEPHGGVGCGLDACEACVCYFDPTCCTLAWDQLCVVAHVRRCAQECNCLPLGPRTCCEPHAETYCTTPDNPEAAAPCSSCKGTYEDFAFLAPWDERVFWRLWTQCKEKCNCPPPPLGDCCEPHFGHSCESPGCTSCVCAADPHCCSTLWDEACAESARRAPCDLPCGCVPKPKEPCCAAHDSPGCDDAQCEACVCALDPSCCDTLWDGLCALRRAPSCEEVCGCSTFASPASCAVAHIGPGCAEDACAKCVCAKDARCCLRDWDWTCVEHAKVNCPQQCTAAQ